MKTFKRLVLVLALAGPLLASPRAQAHDQADETERATLEELLERYRAQRDKLFDLYRGRLQEVLEEIEAAFESSQPKRLATLRIRLHKVALEATPLLVPWLDPGIKPTDAEAGRAREVARALAALPTRSITRDLLAILSGGSTAGRENALEVLAHSDDPERVAPALVAHFSTALDSRKGAILAAIATIGGTQAELFLGRILNDPDPKLVKLSLEALAHAGVETAAARIAELLQIPTKATPLVVEIVAYYRACPAVIDDDLCELLMGLAEALAQKPNEAVLILGLLAEAHEEWDSKLKRRLRKLAEASVPRIQDASLVALARSGDRSSRKKLLDPHDARIKRNATSASAWQERAQLNYKIAEYKDAIDDYTEAVRLGEARGYPRADNYIGVARCYAQLGKLRDAKAWLERAPISISALRGDPVFAEMLAHEEYRRVFRLKDD